MSLKSARDMVTCERYKPWNHEWCNLSYEVSKIQWHSNFILDTFESNLIRQLTTVNPGISVFTTIPLPGGGIPPMIGECVEQENWIERVTEMDLKKY